MNQALINRLLLLGKLGISLLLLIVLFNIVDSERVGQQLLGANLWLLALAGVCMLGQQGVATFKWYVLLEGREDRPEFLTLLKINLIGNFVNLFMPGTVGGDSYRVYRVGNKLNSYSSALASVLVDRGTGVLAILFIGISGVLYLYLPEYGMQAIALLFSILVVGYILAVGPVFRLFQKMDQKKLFGLVGLITQVLDFAKPSRKILLVVIIAFLFQLGNVFISLIYASATDVIASLNQLLVAVPAAYVVEILPISINGIGLREGALTVIFRELELDPVHGLVLGLTISGMRYVTNLIGGVLLAIDMFSQKRKAPLSRNSHG